MSHEDATKKRAELVEHLQELRRQLKELGPPLGVFPILVETLDKNCGVEHALDNLTAENVDTHMKWHDDMRTAQRSLEACVNRYNEMRAHLAIAINALKDATPYEVKPTDPTVGKDTTELN